MGGVAFDRGDKVRDEIISTLELDVYVRPGLFSSIHEPDEAIVRDREPDDYESGYAEDDVGGHMQMVSQPGWLIIHIPALAGAIIITMTKRKKTVYYVLLVLLSAG